MFSKHTGHSIDYRVTESLKGESAASVAAVVVAWALRFLWGAVNLVVLLLFVDCI